MKNYEVTLTATSCKTVTLSAESEKAAKKLAAISISARICSTLIMTILTKFLLK